MLFRSALWKQHREAFQNGDVLPVGDAPNGYSWTGFVSFTPAAPQTPRQLYALIFRELTESDETIITLPLLSGAPNAARAEKLAGEGEAVIDDSGKLHIRISTMQQFFFGLWLLE